MLGISSTLTLIFMETQKLQLESKKDFEFLISELKTYAYQALTTQNSALSALASGRKTSPDEVESQVKERLDRVF